MADNGKIKVTLGEGVEVELDKDTPNLKEFVKSITANRKSIDKEKIAVEGPAPEFDAQSFKEVITEVVTEYLNAISIEEQCYLKTIGKAEALLDDETEEGIEAEA